MLTKKIVYSYTLVNHRQGKYTVFKSVRPKKGEDMRIHGTNDGQHNQAVYARSRYVCPRSIKKNIQY